ncbi:hypothetical protein [Paenibacillus silvisoli]|uniref:hypothetical protein n=1 Tax=Paenibacillus silvisoli TaxID=3110539 RepID=UPI00280387B8|nr:hypothetical protein [Paenibacillus silvisoli]
MDQYNKNPHQLQIRAEDIKVRGFEIGTAFATGLGVIGASVGFKLTWGPIAWGMIFAFIGLFIGFGAVCLNRLRKGERPITRSPRRPQPEIVVIVYCSEEKSAEVRNIFWAYRAISVGDVPEPASL